MSGTPRFVTLYGVHPSGTSIQRSGSSREIFLTASANLIRNREFHVDYLGHAHLRDFPAFDSVGLGEGEKLICDLADHIDDVAAVPGLCFRRLDGSIGLNPSTGNPDKLDELPFPKRGTFHDYYGQRIARVLTSRGCWRDCAFCSINAWYERAGGKKFRIRSIDNLVAELKDLYLHHGVRIFNFQDDNFFLPNPEQACRRFEALRDGLRREGVEELA